jgi:predicted RNA binding protein YcfA (HicA-like mRNA interferase family)
MADVDKIVKKMRNQPHGIRVEEAHRVLTAYEYTLHRQKGSHRQYVNSNGDVITIPDKSPLKKFYVDSILGRIGKK